MKNYILLLFIPAWCSSFAQQKNVRQKNDSVFSATALSSVPLTDIAKQKTIFLPATTRPGTLSLFIFLSPECPLCQNYTRVLNKLEHQYGERVKFYGIIPGKSYSTDTIKAFAKKYKVFYSILVDGSSRLSRYLQATITPEVILLNEKNELVYKGAIDNWIKDLGKMRVRVTENYLQDAIEQYPDQKRNAPKRTRAIGCLINDI